ncbi:MAG: aspartate/glutamate racemase family protein [Rhodanobacteraceae bacterium]
MKKIGILGGVAWPSTLEYYAGICHLAEARHIAMGRAGIVEMPEMAIESLDMARATSLLGGDHDEASWTAFDGYHRAGLQRLERSGAEFAVIACNTAHHRFAQITRGVAMPVLSILDIAASACAHLGLTRLLILGTAQVMTSHVFPAAFLLHGIEAKAPQGKRSLRAIAAAINILQEGRIDDAPARIRAVVRRTAMGHLHGSSAVYLGCTELPLAFPAFKHVGIFEADGIRYVNSTALHVQYAFDYATAGSIGAEPPRPYPPPYRIPTATYASSIGVDAIVRNGTADSLLHGAERA